MSIISLTDITIISLALSVIAVAVVLSSLWFLLKELRITKTLSNSLDASALVKEFSLRQKQLEQMIIDQKVRLEILELRLTKQGMIQPGTRSNPRGYFPENSLPMEKAIVDDEAPHRFQEENRVFQSKLAKKSDSRTINEMLQAVVDIGEGVTARKIQQKIGRSREHTARMMNLLYRQGLISRDVNSRPFTYSLTKAGENNLGNKDRL